MQGDTVAALVVASIIFGAAGRLIYENARVLMDTTPADAQASAEAAITELGHDIELQRLRVRESGGHYFADAVVAVSPAQAVVESHGVADEIEAAVQRVLPNSDVIVHLEPRREGLDLRDRVLAAALAEPLVREAHDIVIYEHNGSASVSLHLKLEPDVPIADAHDVAERVEAVVRAEPGVDDVRIHLEPLEAPVAARPDESRTKPDEAERARITDLVVRRTGRPPNELRLLHAAGGLVVFLSIAVPREMALPDAHELASRLEDDIQGGPAADPGRRRPHRARSAYTGGRIRSTRPAPRLNVPSPRTRSGHGMRSSACYLVADFDPARPGSKRFGTFTYTPLERDAVALSPASWARSSPAGSRGRCRSVA